MKDPKSKLASYRLFFDADTISLKIFPAVAVQHLCWHISIDREFIWFCLEEKQGIDLGNVYEEKQNIWSKEQITQIEWDGINSWEKWHGVQARRLVHWSMQPQGVLLVCQNLSSN